MTRAGEGRLRLRFSTSDALAGNRRIAKMKLICRLSSHFSESGSYRLRDTLTHQ